MAVTRNLHLLNGVLYKFYKKNSSSGFRDVIEYIEFKVSKLIKKYTFCERDILRQNSLYYFKE